MYHTDSMPKRKTAQLCLGTAQLGMAYGAANRAGMPSDAEAAALVMDALDSGIRLFDTAQAYGEAEARLGVMHDTLSAHKAEVITKLAPVRLEAGENPAALAARVEGLILRSCERLRMAALPYVLLHRAEHLQVYEGRIWQELLRLQREGRIGRLGVSVASAQELRMALDTAGVTCVQVPFNMVDSRLASAGMIATLAQRRDVLVCVRSIFLQGVLSLPAAHWPVLPAAQASEVAGLLDEFVARFGRESRADLACAYVRAQEWIDVAVVGMENGAQLRHNVALFASKPLSEGEMREVEAAMPALPEAFLNPALWPKKEE